MKFYSINQPLLIAMLEVGAQFISMILKYNDIHNYRIASSLHKPASGGEMTSNPMLSVPTYILELCLQPLSYSSSCSNYYRAFHNTRSNKIQHGQEVT
jgi:hypothetical protein